MVNHLSKFLGKKAKIIFTISSCLLLFTVFTHIVLKRYSRVTARHYATLEYIDKISQKDQIDYLIVGDSTGMHSLLPKLITENTYSVCISGASLLDVYKTLSKFNLSHIKKGIILANSFNSELHYSDDFWSRFVLANSYSIQELVELYNESQDKKIFPATEYSFLEFYLNALSTKYMVNKFTLVHLLDYYRSMHWDTNYFQKFSEELSAKHGHISLEEPNSHFKLSDEYFFKPADFFRKPFKINKTDAYYLLKIYTRLHRANLPLIMATMPITEEENVINVSNFKNSYQEYFQAFEITHPSFAWIPIKIKLSRSYFFDFNHVNSEGAQKITSELLKTLEERKISIVK